MALRPNLMCYKCKNAFPRDSLINYKNQNYCPECHKLKLADEAFADFVCRLFKLKAPGPVIYSQRRRLKETLGLTDGQIMKTLHYIYNVRQVKRTTETLGLVTPENVEMARRYYEELNRQIEVSRKALEQQRIALANPRAIPLPKEEERVVKRNSVLEELRLDDLEE